MGFDCGGKDAFTLVMAWLYAQTRRGMSAEVTDAVAQLLGRPPIPLRQFIEENRALWAQPAAVRT